MLMFWSRNFLARAGAVCAREARPERVGTLGSTSGGYRAAGEAIVAGHGKGNEEIDEALVRDAVDTPLPVFVLRTLARHHRTGGVLHAAQQPGPGILRLQ